MSVLQDKRLSIATLFRCFWRKIGTTLTLTTVETSLFALLPLLIGRAIDGLLERQYLAFQELIVVLVSLVVVAVLRRFYDTRAYSGIGVEFAQELIRRSGDEPVSTVNARVAMGQELVDFLEEEFPVVLTALIHLLFSLVILANFHVYLALSAAAATLTALGIYGISGGRFFRLNKLTNDQMEKQVSVLNTKEQGAIDQHLFNLRRFKVKLSDTEAVVYGVIFLVLLGMLSFNLWFAATQSSASPGEIFAIVTYSYEFIQSAVVLPITLQSLTRLGEITGRINGELGEV